MSLEDDQAPMDRGDLEPKHRVFLCHSGLQKGFVAQLDLDLRHADRHPFFDRNRDSLSIGETFPPLIFKAIEHCQVGVVILSEQFFMSSPWPMFEVVKMVDCGRKIIPVFLGISPEGLSSKEKLAEWRLKWQAWEKSNKRIDIPKWEIAVKKLRELTGPKYNHAAGAGAVVDFREEIVQEICNVVPAFHRWDDLHVKGKSRLSKVIRERIASTPECRGAKVVGLYGVGGIGKTTACNSLCEVLYEEFDGRVCHLEFGKGKFEVDRLQEALKRLTGTSEYVLRGLNLKECWSRLKNCMQSKKVFLAIDNVTIDFEEREEVRKYLEKEYFPGSIVMVTARAVGELKYVTIDESKCLLMPELVEDEAEALFLHCAKRSKNEVDVRVLNGCIDRCYFRKGDGNGSHYHPLALKVLGSHLASIKARKWQVQLEKEDVFNPQGEPQNPVFSVLRRSFDVLRDEDKLLFMDVALFDDGDSSSNGYKMWRTMQNLNFPYSLAHVRTWYIFEWLSMVHRIPMGELKTRLKAIKKKSLLEDLGDGIAQIGMHDLWREFAVMETRRGVKESRWWVYEVVGAKASGGYGDKELFRWQDVVMRGDSEESSLTRGGWTNLRRICFTATELHSRRVKLTSVNFTSCSNVTVLKLVNVGIENEALDLGALEKLISLEIVSGDIFDEGFDKDTLRFQRTTRLGKVSGIGQLTNLAVLIWLGIDNQNSSAVGEISRLTKLEFLQLTADFPINTSTRLNMEQMLWLRVVRVRLSGMVIEFCLGSNMKRLRILDLKGCSRLKSCAGVGGVVGLEVLVLDGCSTLEELPNLGKLAKLRELDITGCWLLRAVPGLGSLFALEELYASWCDNVAELPDISKLRNLKVFHMLRNGPWMCIPGLGELVALRELHVDVTLSHHWPNCGNLTELQNVHIFTFLGRYDNDEWSGSAARLVLNLGVLEYVSTVLFLDGLRIRELTNLSKLTALKSLSLVECRLERLPHMGKNMSLESLVIEKCEILEGWDGVGRLGPSKSQTEVDLQCAWTLPLLQVLEWTDTAVVDLLDLSHFPRLRTLYLSSFTSRRPQEFLVLCHAEHVHLEVLRVSYLPITALQDLSKFPSLRELQIQVCSNLVSLTISEPLTALEALCLLECRSLNVLPDFDLFPKLDSLKIRDCGVNLDAQEDGGGEVLDDWVPWIRGKLDAQKVEKLETRGFRSISEGFWKFKSQHLIIDEIVLPAPELIRNSGVQLALDGQNDLDSGPSSLEVECSSREFVPYNESISELGLVSKLGSLELQGSGEIEKGQSMTLKAIKWGLILGVVAVGLVIMTWRGG